MVKTFTPELANGARPSRSRLGRRRAIALAGVGVVLGSLALSAAPANAAAPANCPAYDVCVWRDSGYETSGNTAGVVVFGHYIPAYDTWDYYGTTLNAGDSISSTYNNGATHTAYYFKGNSAGGAVFTKGAGTGDSDFNNGTPAGSFNDAVNSAYFSDYLPS
jgi:hypothetical protein